MRSLGWHNIPCTDPGVSQLHHKMHLCFLLSQGGWCMDVCCLLCTGQGTLASKEEEWGMEAKGGRQNGAWGG